MSVGVVPVAILVDEGVGQDRCELEVWDQFKYLVASAGPDDQLATIQLEINLKRLKETIKIIDRREIMQEGIIIPANHIRIASFRSPYYAY